MIGAGFSPPATVNLGFSVIWYQGRCILLGRRARKPCINVIPARMNITMPNTTVAINSDVMEVNGTSDV